MKKITTYLQATQYLLDIIPKTNEKKFSGQFGLERAQLLQKYLGNPQEKLKVIHIAGTSGKGSTSYLISKILTACGFRVGLAVKPHIYDMRERFQINHSLISQSKFCNYLNEVIPAIQKVASTKYGYPTYYETIVSLTYYLFWKERVQYAVIETAMGGLYDGSNTVSNPYKVSVLTRIGFDHMHILGNSLSEIAYQKAMIMHSGNKTFTIAQRPQVMRVFKTIAKKNGADLEIIEKNKHYSHIVYNKDAMVFDFQGDKLVLPKICLGLLGDYQVENASLALAATHYVAERDHFIFNEQKIREALSSASFPARFHTVEWRGKIFILDGAHNPQKMRAFIAALRKLYPQKKFTFIVGFKQGKEVDKMIKIIAKNANNIIITDFFTDKVDWPVYPESPERISSLLSSLGFKNYSTISPYSNAVGKIAKNKGSEPIVVTGSLYLLAEIYTFFKAHSSSQA